MKNRTPLVSLVLVCTCVSTAWAQTTAPSSAQPPQDSASFRQALRDAEYPVEFASAGKARLKDGVFEEPAAPGSATKTTIRLGTEQSFGDVNGDGVEDAAATLVVDPGGSGTLTYLALVINDKGAARPLAAVLLGDRIIVRSILVQPGGVMATMLLRRPDEPMTARPRTEITRTFELHGGRLVEAN